MGNSSEDSGPEAPDQGNQVNEDNNGSDGEEEEVENRVEDEESIDHIGVDDKRFAIPCSDEFLMYENVFKFVVKHNTTLPEARVALRGYSKFVDDDEYFEIHTFFDDFYHISRSDGKIKKWDMWLQLIEVLLKAFNSFKPDLVNTVCHVASVGDILPENMKDTCADRIEIMEMLVYLIKNLVLRLEDIAIKRAYKETGIELLDEDESGPDEDVVMDENMSNEGFETWENVRKQVIEMIDFICCLNISRGNGEVIENAIQFLSRPPRLNTELLRCFSTIILKFASHPRFSKKIAKDDLAKLFTHLRPLCVGFDFANSLAEEIVDATMKYNYLKDARSDYPFVDLVEKISEPGRMHEQMLSVMLLRLWRLLPRESSATSPLARPYVLLVQKLSQRAPEVFLDHCTQAAHALNFDPPALRTAILEAFCHNICNNEVLAPSHVRPGSSIYTSYTIMTDCLRDFLEDTNPQVRLNVLNFWVHIANARRVPFDSLKKGLFNSITERLKTEKSAAARKLAMQFLVLYLLLGPYGKELSFDSLSEACSNLANFIKRIEVIDPERPGVTVIMERFNTFVNRMRQTLKRVIETKKYEENSDDLVDAPLEKVIVALVSMIELRMDDVMCALAKMCFLRKFKNINPNLPTRQLVEELINELRRYYITMNMGYIGDSFGQDHLEEMGAAYEENMDRAERAVNVVQEKMLFAEQMTLLFPHIYEALEQSGFTDINYAVTFFATCYRFKIRKAASALYRMYMAGNKNLSTEVLNTVRMLFLKRNIRGDVDIVETANCLMERLNDKEEGDRVAIQDLLYYAFSNTPFPGGLVSHLINIIIKVPPPYKCPAFTALALLTRVDPYGMRKYLRVFHKCVKSEDVREACDALKVITNLIPLQEDDPAKEEENYRFRLRATDSIFHDIESLFLRGFLADDKKHLDDGSLVSDYWYTCARTCIRAIFAIASDVDYLISRILGKVLWHAKRAADVYIAFTRSQENRPIPEGVIVDLIKKENERLCVAWQRTTERALMVVGEVIEGTLFYVDNNFPKLLKRAMELDDNAEEELPDVPEPYADYNKEHTDIEMDFAYREGIFARTITPAKPKTADSSKSEKSEVESERSEPSVNAGNANEPTEDEVEEDESNRPSTDELIRTRTLELLESRLLRKDGVMGQCLTMVVFFVRTPNVPKAIADAALRAFSKFLLISPQVTERASSLFLTYTCCHPDPDMREYLLVSAVDVMQRFPSMLDRHALFLFDMPIDKDVNVKITALLYLTRMLTRDILKPRGTLSNVALCMLKKRPSNDQSCPVSGSREVIALARKLFYEISLKGNLLVNVMPDLICRVCRWEKEVPLNNFKEIVEILLPLIADKPLDTIVEKMCQRFEFCSSREATAHNQHIAHYFSYFISQIPLSDTSFYKMRDSLPYFATFLEDGIVYHDMIAPVNHLITSTQSVDVKHDAEEFLRKVEFLHVKSTLTDEERDRMSKAVGPINLDVPVKLDKDGNPIIFSFADCDEPVEYDDN